MPSDPAKSEKFPRTSRRVQRIQHVLARRQPDLTVVLENVHDPHNIGAVLRSCDAVGTMRVHTVYTIEERPARAYARSTSGSASKWIEVVHHDSVASCYQQLHRDGLQVLVTALAEDTLDLYETDLTAPIALVFGNEHRGASEEAISLADATIAIPMMGMVESLNISVACAVSLFEALRQRRQAGAYLAPRLDEGTLERIANEWIRR